MQLGYCLYINLQFITDLLSLGFLSSLYTSAVSIIIPQTPLMPWLSCLFLPSWCAVCRSPWLWPVTEGHFAACHLGPGPLTWVLALGKDPIFLS